MASGMHPEHYPSDLGPEPNRVVPCKRDARLPRLGFAWQIAKKAVNDFIDDDCPAMAAAIAYYALFSLAPMLVIVLAVAGRLVSPEDVEGRMYAEFVSLLGVAGADAIRGMLRAAQESAAYTGPLRYVLGTALLLFGATSAFANLQLSLNRAWEVRAKPQGLGLGRFFLRRLLSFGTILVLAFLLIVSLAASALLSAFGARLEAVLPAGVSQTSLWLIDLGVSLALLAGVLALIFKFLPDALVTWREALVGGAITAVLFSVGKLLIGLYLGQSDVGSAFGAAGALAVILVWVYYASTILLLGAEITQAWACLSGRAIRPARGAVAAKRDY
jgi:membrane protein